MSKSRLEWKVGLFVIIGLGLLAALLIQFSKGTSFRHTKRIYLRSGNVSGLKPRAYVLMAGVQIGTVSHIALGDMGTNVIITLRILDQYQIRTNAEFSIEQSGFLGDQYVSVTAKPAKSDVPVFQDGGEAVADAPWSLIGVANRVLKSLENFDQAAVSLQGMIDAVHKGALGDQTLSNFSETISNLKVASAGAVVTLSNLDSLVLTAGPAISQSGTNLAAALSQIDEVALSAKSLIASNRPAIDQSISNLQSAANRLDSLLADVQSGQGLAGKVLKDEKMAAKATEIVTDLSVTSSNLNRLGLWRVLFPKKEASASSNKLKTHGGDVLTAPKDPYRN